MVSLLGTIRDIAHNYDGTKHGLMSIIESDMDLYLGFQSPDKDCDDYMAVFKARVDTINVHGGLAGKHPGHFSKRFSRIQEEKGLKVDKLKLMQDDGNITLHVEVTEIVREEYLVILSIEQADKGRYG